MPDSALTAVWVVPFVFAHTFALYWVAKTLLLQRPGALQAFWHKITRGGRSVFASFSSSNGDAPDSAPAQQRGTLGHAIDRSILQRRSTLTLSPTTPSSAMAAADAAQNSGEVNLTVLRRLTVVQVELEWRDLGCTYKTASGERVAVLQGVSGRAQPGEMSALMGPSGAGKSTLLDILAMRKRVGDLSGSVTANGKPVNRKFVKHTSYVPQDDNFVPTMTTEETALFFAALLLPLAANASARRRRALEVLDHVGLGHARCTLVGGELPGGLSLRGLSGGERKRLSVAAGIMGAPSALFLDEPTSGLDSASALSVMRHLRSMAAGAGHIVLASIHQPRAAIWNLFDTVSLLSQGMLMYHGPLSGTTPWFSGHLGFAYDPERHGVASDWVMDLVSLGFTETTKVAAAETRRTAFGSVVEIQAAAAAFSKRYAALQRTQAQGGCETALALFSRRACAAPDRTLHVPWRCAAADAATAGTAPAGPRATAWPADGRLATAAMAVTLGGAAPGAVCTSDHPSEASALSAPRGLLYQRSSSSIADDSDDNSDWEGSEHLMANEAIHTYPVPLAERAAAAHSATTAVEAAVAPVVKAKTEPEAAHTAWLGSEGSEALTAWGAAGDKAPCAAGGAAAERRGVKWADKDAIGPAPGGAILRRVTQANVSPLPAQSLFTEDSAVAAIASMLEPLPSTSSCPTPSLGVAALRACDSTGSSGTAVADALTSSNPCSPTLRKATPWLPQGRSTITTRPADDRIEQVLGAARERCTSILAGGDPCRGGSGGSNRWSRVPARFWRQYQTLVWRETLSMTRNPADVAGRILTFTWVAVFIGLIYFSLAADLESVRLRLSVLFCNLAFFLLMPYVSMSLFTADRRFFIADVSARLYRPLVYYAAKVTATLPFNIVSAVVYCLVTYGMSGLHMDGARAVLASTLISTLVSLISVQVLHFAATVAANQDIAFMLAILWTAVNLLMSNFFIMYGEMRFQWLSQLRWLSAMGFAYEGLARVELSGVNFGCANGAPRSFVQLLPSLLPNTALATNRLVSSTLLSPGDDCVGSGNALLEYLSLTRPLGATVGILLLYLTIMHALTYTALLSLSRRERR